MNNILKIPAFQRKKAIPKQLKDLELLPLNEEFSKLTMPIVSDDDLRPVMMGNYFDLEKRKIASTDAHKLIAINMPNETFNYISNNYKEELQKEPKGLIFHTISQLQKDYNDLVKLAYKNNSTDFQSFNEFVKFRAIQDGRYPNYEAVTPKEFIAEINVDYQKLYWYAKVLVDAKVIDDINKIDSGNYYVYQNKKIEYLKDSYVSFLNPSTKQILLTYTLDGKKEYIGFNARLLCEILKFAMEFNGKYFGKVGVNATGKAMVIELENGLNVTTDSIGLIMPVILNRGESTNTIGNDGSPLDEMKTYEMYYDLDTNSIISDKENYPIDEEIGFMPNKVGSTQKMTSQQGKMEKHYEMVRKVQAERESKVENNSEDLIDKKIRGLRIALKVAIKGEEKLIEKRILALEIAKKMSSSKFSVSEKMSNLDNNKIKDWYIKNYPADDLKNKLDDKNTFEDLWNSLGKNKDVYEIIGIGDSIIRERLFEHLAELKNVSYNVVYDKWLDDSEDIGSVLNKVQLLKIKNKYNYNEDINYRSENVLLLAENFGTNNDIYDAKQILKKHEKDGHLTSENSEKRRELSERLILKARKIMSEKGVKFVKGGNVDDEWYVMINYYEPNAKEDRFGNRLTYWRKTFNVRASSKEESIKKATDLFNSVKANKNRQIQSIVSVNMTTLKKTVSEKYPRNWKKLKDGGSVDGGDYVREDLNFYKKGGGVANDSKFYVKSNFGNWSVIDRKDNKMVVGYSKKEDAKTTSDGLNKIDNSDELKETISILKSMKGYGHFLNNYAKGGGVSKKERLDAILERRTEINNYLIEKYGRSRGKNKAEKDKIDALAKEYRKLGDEYLELNGGYNEYAGGGEIQEFESPRIYIIDKEAYNNNIEDGIWLDFSDYKNVDELMTAIQEFLDEREIEEYEITDGEYLPAPMGMDLAYLTKVNFEEIYLLMDIAKEKGISIDDAYEEMYGENDNFAKGGYTRPSYKINTTGFFSFKTKDKEYIVRSSFFERKNDIEDSLQIQDELRGELGSIIITNSAWKRLSDGNTIKARSNRGNLTGTLTRVANLNENYSLNKMAKGGEVNSSTQKLIEELKKNSNESITDVMTNKQGEKYRFRNWKLKYNSASNFLVKLFEKASEENTGKSYNRNFYNGDYSFYYNRPEMKNKPNGSMQMRMLEVLNTFKDGGMVEFHDYKGIEIMYEPNEKEYYANDMVFYSLEDAQEYIDSGEANKTPKHIVELYRRGAMAKGGSVGSQDIHKLAEEMSEKDFRNKFLTLSKSEKDDVESLIRLGDDKKLALITILDKRNEPNNDDFYRQAYHYKAGGDVEDEKVYIDYMNKEKGFKRDRIYFDSYAEAVEWGKKNFERFNTDMINYV